MMSRTKNRGFTLIEIAIVLVIIGLLLGGVLKGQELINNARVKSFANDFRNIPVALYAYQDRFRAIPGDDPQASTHVPGATNATTPAGTLANGQINGAWNSATNTDESCLFWQHIRLANLAPGSTTVTCDVAYYPLNASGGQIGIQSAGGFATITLPTAMTGTYIICSANISGQFVLQLDTLLDDGNPSTGAMRAIDQTALAAATAVLPGAVNSGGVYTVCLSV